MSTGITSETEAPILLPETSVNGISSDFDINDGVSLDSNIGTQRNDGSIPMPIIIVFIFMFIILGVICIQQLQRMFAEHKEYNDIKFDIPENRATSRSGKTYGTVTYSSAKQHQKQKKTKQKKSSSANEEEEIRPFQKETVLNMIDEKLQEMEQTNNKEKTIDSSDDSIELGSGYESNNNKNNHQTSDISELNMKKRNKLKQQVLVATQGLKEKIGQKLTSSNDNKHSSNSSVKNGINKLKSKQSKYKGYGSVKQKEEDADEVEEDGSELERTEKEKETNKEKKGSRRRSVGNLYDSDGSDVRHKDYKMNYGYTEDYDCDFEDSDTQLSEEGDDKPRHLVENENNETILKRVTLE